MNTGFSSNTKTTINKFDLRVPLALFLVLFPNGHKCIYDKSGKSPAHSQSTRKANFVQVHD